MAFDKRKALQNALTFTQQGKWDKAITEYLAILRADPRDVTVCNTLGDLYARVGRTGEAIDQYLKVGSLYRTDGLSFKAIAVYKKITKLDSTRIEAHLACADLYEEQGLTGEAKIQLATVAEQYAREGNGAKLIEVYQRLAQLDPGNVGVLAKLADALARAGKREEAADGYQRAAEVARAAGREPEARRFLQRVFELKPDSPMAAFATAEQALRAGQIPQAVEALVKVTKAEPENAQAWRLLGEAHSRLLRPAEAVAALEQAVRLGVSGLDLWQPLAVNLVRAGRTAEGMAVCDRATQDALTRGGPDEALAMARAFLAELPDLAAAHTHLVELLRQQGRDEETREALWGLATVHEVRGESDAAAEVYRQLVERYPSDEEARSRLAATEGGPPAAVAAEAELTSVDAESGLQIEGPSVEPHPAPELPAAEAEPLLPEAPPPTTVPEPVAGPLLLTAEPAGGAEDLDSFDLSLVEEPGGEAGAAPLLETVEELRPRPRAPSLFEMDDTGELPGVAGTASPPSDAFGAGPEGSEGTVVSCLDGATSTEDLPGEAAELLAEAEVYLKYGLGEKARERLGEVVRLLPDYVPARRRLKALYVERSQIAEACGEALAIARLLLDQGQRDAAIAELQDGLGLDPVEPELTRLLGSLGGVASSEVSSPPAAIASTPAIAPPTPGPPPPPPPPVPSPRGEPPLDARAASETGAPETAAPDPTAAPCPPRDLIGERTPAPFGPALESPGAFDPSLDGDLSAAGPPPSAGEIAPTQLLANEGDLPEDLRALLEESDDEPSVLVAGEEKDQDQGMAEDLAEAEFYLSQDMVEEARSVLRRMQARAPEHPTVRHLRAKLAAGAVPFAPPESPALASVEALEDTLDPPRGRLEPTEATLLGDAPLLGQGLEQFPGLEDLGTGAALLETPALLSASEAPAPESSPAAEDRPGAEPEAAAPLAAQGPRDPAIPRFAGQADASGPETAEFVDLGRELEAEMAAEEQAAAADRGGALVNELLQEFQKGVQEHLDEKDFETHYNLGMAYKEMDLYDEAIQEFRLAARDPGRALTCANLVGLCSLSKGDPAQAIRDLQAGLGLFGHPREAYQSLRYDLGLAYEAHGELGLALECYETLQRENARFRDVQTRTQALRDQLRAKAADVPPAAPAPAVPPEQARRTASKKKKISFV